MRIFALLIGLLAGAAAPAQAPAPPGPPPSPYEALIPVTDTGEQGQASALNEALGVVLTNVSGLSSIRSEPAAAPILSQARTLVQHYGLERDPATAAMMLRAAFDPQAVDAALKRAGLPVFGRVAGAEQESALVVRGVVTIADYQRALAALRNLRGVKQVAVDAVRGDAVNFRVRFEGDAWALARAIAAGAPLVAAPAEAARGALVYMLAR